MAIGKKSGGRPFQPGNKANPIGARAHSAATKALRQATVANLEEVAEIILSSNVAGLKDIALDPNSTVLKVWVAKAAARGISRGELGPLEMILNRVLGRPKESVNLNVTNHSRIVDLVAQAEADADAIAALEDQRPDALDEE